MSSLSGPKDTVMNMKKITIWITEKLVPFGNKVANNKYLSSLSESMMLVTPLIIVGSFACLIANLNLGFWQNFLSQVPALFNALNEIQAWTLNMIGVFVCIVLAYKVSQKLKIEPLVSAIVALAVFFILTPAVINESIAHEWLGYKGMITGIILGMIVPSELSWFEKHNLTIKMPDSVPEFVQTSFTSLIPVTLVIILASIVNEICLSFGGATFPEIIYRTLQIPFTYTSSSLLGTVVFMFGCCLFMAIGIHANTLLYVIFPIYMANGAENLAAIQQGMQPTNIVTSSFFMHIVIGSVGCILPLVVLMATKAVKSERLQSIGRLALVPACFNISEPVLFGAPILFNPVLIIPYIGTSCLNVIIGYLLIYSGIMPPLSGVEVAFSVPVVLSGFLAQGWQFALLQIGLFFLDMAIYYPFLKAYDNTLVKEEMSHE